MFSKQDKEIFDLTMVFSIAITYGVGIWYLFASQMKWPMIGHYTGLFMASIGSVAMLLYLARTERPEPLLKFKKKEWKEKVDEIVNKNQWEK